MAKIYGLFGSMTGKLADTVMAVRNGEQIARKYQPVVFNPSSEAQVAQRAKLKLLSQLSAVMAPVIAIPKQGPKSSRNLFTKENFPAATFADGEAQIDLSEVKLTTGVLSLPALSIVRDGSTITIGLLANTGLDVDRVVYGLFQKSVDGTLLFIGSGVVSTPGADNSYSTEFQLNRPNSNIVAYAYGVRDNTNRARVSFGNLTAPTAAQVAKLVASRILTEIDVTLTETVARESNPE